MIRFIENEDLFPHIKEYDLVILTANIYNTIKHGFSRDVVINYPYVWEADLNSKYGDLEKLGTLKECSNANEPTFIIAYVCRGYPSIKHKGEKVDFLSYESLEKCLRLLNIRYKDKRIACPLLGCSRFDGNGDKTKVMDIINKSITNLDLDVYDFFQQTREEKLKETYLKEKILKETDRTAYYEAVKKRKEEAEIRYQKNGRVRY